MYPCYTRIVIQTGRLERMLVQGRRIGYLCNGVLRRNNNK